MKRKETSTAKDRLKSVRNVGLWIGTDPHSGISTEPSTVNLDDGGASNLDGDIGGNVGHIVDGQNVEVHMSVVDPPHRNRNNRITG